MNTELLHIPVPEGHERDLERAAEILRRGGLVAFPTETVYGLGANATDAGAAAAIYAAKGRPSDNPLIIHIAAPADVEPFAHTSPAYYRLAEHFMPGALTVILPKKDTIPHSVTGGLDTVAVRCPSHPVAHALIAAAGVPIAAPSANRSGRPSPTTAAHVVADMWGRVDAIIDGGECDIGLESTIVKLEGERGILLRPGAITPEELSLVLEEVEISPTLSLEVSDTEHPLCPGMKYRHYAPRATLTLLDGESRDVADFLAEVATDPAVGILCFDEETEQFPKSANLFPVGARDDLAAQAHRLFAALRAADENPALTQLYAHLPPQKGLGLALYNRAIRAAAHHIQHVTFGKEV